MVLFSIIIFFFLLGIVNNPPFMKNWFWWLKKRLNALNEAPKESALCKKIMSEKICKNRQKCHHCKKKGLWHIKCEMRYVKCDRLGEVNLLSKFQLLSSYCFWITIDIWHATPDTWHLPCDTWHMTCVTLHTGPRGSWKLCQTVWE